MKHDPALRLNTVLLAGALSCGVAGYGAVPDTRAVAEVHNVSRSGGVRDGASWKRVACAGGLVAVPNPAMLVSPPALRAPLQTGRIEANVRIAHGLVHASVNWDLAPTRRRRVTLWDEL